MSKRSALSSRGPPKKQRQLTDQAEHSPGIGTWLDDSKERNAIPPISTAEEEYTKKCKLLPVPLLHEYKGGDFYFERDCYDEYFRLVDHQVVNEKQKCVTVTGTPGIGKSIFYVYFFDRFRKAHPGEWIVVAATYHKNFELSEFAIFEDETDMPTAHYAYASKQLLTSEVNSAVEQEAERAAVEMRKPKQMLFLCDGPPPLIWPQTVVFTSPNEEWMSLSEIDSQLLEKFRRQKIIPVSTPTGSESIKEIKGIGIGTASVLSKYEVFTIDQLEKKIERYANKKVRMKDPEDKRAWDNAVKCWNDREVSIQYAMHNDTVADISQYVCSLDDMNM
ncbi:hypothetical protein PF002_g1450 [Phytophthora fragariae]|uniref:Uncharacterized protein n=1 Tax=Phytophthora fragariae TaxID=53985 RepID=A0A6A4AI87_9STRA|nr:hypothetical protein PF002_g1450 [Phytophthora fragariae]